MKLYSRLLLLSSLAFLIQCSPGSFKSETTANNSANSDGSNSGSGNNGAADNSKEQRRSELAAAIGSAKMTGIAANSAVPNIDFDRKAGAYLIRIPMVGLIDIAGEMTFPEYPGMKLSLESVLVDNDYKPYITLSIPVKYVLRNVNEVPARMPSGGMVPKWPAGEAPTKAILLTPNKARKTYLYLSAEAIGLFVETSFNPVVTTNGITLALKPYEIMASDKLSILGYISSVAKVGDFNGGFFLTHRIDPKLGKILDEYYVY